MTAQRSHFERLPAPDLSPAEAARLAVIDDTPAAVEAWEQRVEAAARAIWQCHPGAIPWDDLSPTSPTRAEYRRLAAAALTADAHHAAHDERESGQNFRPAAYWQGVERGVQIAREAHAAGKDAEAQVAAWRAEAGSR